MEEIFQKCINEVRQLRRNRCHFMCVDTQSLLFIIVWSQVGAGIADKNWRYVRLRTDLAKNTVYNNTHAEQCLVQ